MTSIILNFRHQFSSLNNIEKFLVLFPFFAIMGPALINIFYLIVITIFFIKIKEIKINTYFQKKLFSYLIITYLVIWISYFFSDYKNTDNLIRSISVLKFCLIPIVFYYFVSSQFFFKILGIFSGLVTIFLGLDIIFQYLFGYDFFGYVSTIENRYSGFLKEEFVAGSFISFFCIYLLIAMPIRFNNKKDFTILMILSLFFLSVIIITGERLALIRILFVLFCLLIFVKISNWKKFFAGSIVILLIIFFFISNKSFKNRIYETLFMSGINTNYEFSPSIKKLDGKNSFTNSPWIAHWKVAYKIFQDNKLTGIGLKNFRVLSCNDDNYKVRNLLYDSSCTTHPHNTYMEILSELGVVGMIIFLFFIYKFIKNFFEIRKKSIEIKILILSSLILFILIPILPSGSLFSSYNGGIIFYFISSYIALLKLNEFIK